MRLPVLVFAVWWLMPAALAQSNNACADDAAAAAAKPGQISEGRLEGDHTAHLLNVQSKGAFRVDVFADAFDPDVTLCQGSTRLQYNDDGPNSTNARLLTPELAPGAYRLVVGRVDGEGGAYDLLVRPHVAPPLPPTRLISTGTPVPMTLAPGTRAHFALEAEQGAIYQIDARAEDFDTLLEVRAPGDLPDGDPRLQDDDGGGGTNSQLIFTTGRAGKWLLSVSALSDGGGPFTLQVQRSEPRALAVGETRAIFGDAVRSQVFSFTAEPETVYLLEMTSGAFDASIEVSDPANGAVLARDDDGGDGHNARLLFVPPAEGPYTVTAKSLNEGGDYRIGLYPYRRVGQ